MAPLGLAKPVGSSTGIGIRRVELVRGYGSRLFEISERLPSKRARIRVPWENSGSVRWELIGLECWQADDQVAEVDCPPSGRDKGGQHVKPPEHDQVTVQANQSSKSASQHSFE